MFEDQNEVSYLGADATQHAPSPAPSVPHAPVNEGFEPYWQRANIAPYSPRYAPPAKIPIPSSDPLGNMPTIEEGSAFRVGALVSSFIILGAVTGYSLESKVSNRFKAAGYGSLIGAVVANALRYSVAQSTSVGIKAGVMGLVGSAIPLLPVGLTMLTKRPLRKSNIYLIGGWSGIVTSYILFSHLKKRFGF